MTATFLIYRIIRSKSKNRTGTDRTLFATNANFTKTINTQFISGCKP